MHEITSRSLGDSRAATFRSEHSGTGTASPPGMPRSSAEGLGNSTSAAFDRREAPHHGLNKRVAAELAVYQDGLHANRLASASNCGCERRTSSKTRVSVLSFSRPRDSSPGVPRSRINRSGREVSTTAHRSRSVFASATIATTEHEPSNERTACRTSMFEAATTTCALPTAG
jgi:hypothetical protein